MCLISLSLVIVQYDSARGHRDKPDSYGQNFVRTRSKATAVLSFFQSPWAAISSWGRCEPLSPYHKARVLVLLSVALSHFFSHAGLLQ